MVNASTAGEDRCHRIGIPIDKGLITRRVEIFYDLFHDVAVVDDNIIEVLRDIGEGIGLDVLSVIPVSEVGDILEISSPLDRLDQLEQGLLR